MKLDIRIWIRALFSGRSEAPLCDWLHYMLECGKKEAEWEDDEMEDLCDNFLDIVSTIPEGQICNLAYPRLWSSALDLIAQVASKLEVQSFDHGERALRTRKFIDSAHDIPALEQFKSSGYLSYHVRMLKNPGSKDSWNTLNWWIGLHKSLKDRMTLCDHVITKMRRQYGIKDTNRYVACALTLRSFSDL